MNAKLLPRGHGPVRMDAMGSADKNWVCVNGSCVYTNTKKNKLKKIKIYVRVGGVLIHVDRTRTQKKKKIKKFNFFCVCANGVRVGIDTTQTLKRKKRKIIIIIIK
jgi:chloramphenicol 3-O-phosphotransferase